MKYLILLSILFLFIPIARPCLAPEFEKAQERDASLKFKGEVIDYQIQKIAKHALVTFKVQKTLRGESRSQWSLFFRSNSLPVDLKDFQKRFGHIIEVGAREMVAPGEKSDSKKMAFYIVNASCSMNGEDWLLIKIR